MGKKGRKTRWRTLTITDEHSDSEESNTTSSGHRGVSKGYQHHQQQKSYYGRFSYSSQSTPTRRYHHQCENGGTKSTRSSSTASENKITFNEDEYTRITTPRQDVLFKKGYLNKPKTYQTQTSTGNSTTSTGNSTGNGTPDHQSTDLEYESQFVFPNGFVDQNGIYYVNSFEPYPVMVFNPPTYYADFNSVKSKRCSTGSLTESTSPNNEETSQDLSHSETPNHHNISDMNHVYNVIYPPGFYFNGACQPQDVAHHHQPAESRRIKKKRRRKLSRTKSEATTSEYEDESSEEVFSDHQDKAKELSEDVVDAQKLLMDGLTKDPPEELQSEEIEDKKENDEEEVTTNNKPKYDLKPDAEEFVPRAYRTETIPMENVQFIKIPSNFVPLPILNHPLDGFNAFIPPGIPVNFIPQLNFIPNFNNMKEETLPQQKIEEEDTTATTTVEVPKNQIDIAKIVSKLEEAAKEQETVPETDNKTRSLKMEEVVDVDAAGLKKEAAVEQPPKTIRNYSDTLKKSPPQVVCERHQKHMDRVKVNKSAAIKEVVVKNHQVKIDNVGKLSNQWISVSNRKKRKNRNVEEEVEEVQDLVENGIEEVTAAIPEEVSVKEETVKIEELPIVEVKEEVKEVEKKEEKKDKKTVSKKKSKKNNNSSNQKMLMKRVIIKDVDLTTQPEPEKTVKEEVKVEEVIEEKFLPEVTEETIDKTVEEVVEEKEIVELVNEDQLEVEVKKETTPEKKVKKKKKKSLKVAASSQSTLNVSDDSYDFLLEEKTNVEVSQELDKMIQRGMYSSLEEKIKSLNIESSDNFFKTIIHNISRESSVEKNSFGKILTTTTTNLLKKPSTVDLKQLGDFLGETTPKSGGETQDEQYPITKAVKEWMTKTRENTPDVEIFKSPSTIFREFNEDVEEDLMEYWEDPIVIDKNTATSSVEEGEDVLEQYDKNEHYLRIKRGEVEESRGNFPKHGNLPYRAICCSIM